MIISFVNPKGGTGKTTLSVQVAGNLSKKERVLFIDSDGQTSAHDWGLKRGEQSEATEMPFGMVSCPKPIIHKQIESLAEGYRHVVIDTPAAPEKNSMAVVTSAIRASDCIILVVQPSGLDIWGVESALNIIEEVSVLKDNLVTLFAFNRVIEGTVIGRSITEELKEDKIPVLRSHIHQRVIYAEALTSGAFVWEINKRSRAVSEMEKLTREILRYGTHS